MTKEERRKRKISNTKNAIEKIPLNYTSIARGFYVGAEWHRMIANVCVKLRMPANVCNCTRMYMLKYECAFTWTSV